ncbi:MAG: hypothetical protein RIC95_04225 [Vicingaceae bacterium]
MRIAFVHMSIVSNLEYLVRFENELSDLCRRIFKGVDEVRNTRHLKVDSA